MTVTFTLTAATATYTERTDQKKGLTARHPSILFLTIIYTGQYLNVRPLGIPCAAKMGSDLVVTIKLSTSRMEL